MRFFLKFSSFSYMKTFSRGKWRLKIVNYEQENNYFIFLDKVLLILFMS